VACKVIWADAAQDDLDAAASYIYRDSPAYAASFVNRALKAGRSLATFSMRGRIVREFGDANVREIFVFSYRLIYRVEENRVSVLSLIHGSREFQKAWDERDRDRAYNQEIDQ